MSGRLLSRVDLGAVRTYYEHSANYEKTAQWVNKEYDMNIVGSHVRYWLSKPDIRNQKILLFDIETAPMRVYTWGLYNQNIGINQIDKDWYVLMWAAKWYGEKDILSDALINYEDYESEDDCEEYVIMELWDLLDEADIVIAHNAVNFDVKKMNAKFLEYGLDQPSPYQVVDTMRIAKYNFNLSSNKLDYISGLLGQENKNKTDFGLWKGCMEGDHDSWTQMIDYCEQDVNVLEQVYNKIRGWDKRHPQVKFGDKPMCNVCGSEVLTHVGDHNTAASTFEIFKCRKCGHQQRSRVNVANDAERKNRQVNV